MKGIGAVNRVLMPITMSCLACYALASEVDVPNQFTAGTPAIAAEVNENFDAVAMGINDHDRRMAALESAVDQPRWPMFVSGGNQSIVWIDNDPNPRFRIHDSGTQDPMDDLVWDRETGLVWERAPTSAFIDWYAADSRCYKLQYGGRYGFRLPTVEELATLLDLSQPPPTLPEGHPFLIGSHTLYWSSSTNATVEESGQHAWGIRLDGFQVGVSSGRKTTPWHVWCVRGGSGHDVR